MPWRHAAGAARPVAACDQNEEKLAACRAELPDLFYCGDYEAMLARDDVDIVAIYTPDSVHADHIIRAFEAGKEVICTKPLVNSLEAARDILEAGRRSGRKLFVGQSTRFFEPFQRQRRALERGEFGGLEGIELVDAHYLHRMDWYYRKSPLGREGDRLDLPRLEPSPGPAALVSGPDPRGASAGLALRLGRGVRGGGPRHLPGQRAQ